MGTKLRFSRAYAWTVSSRIFPYTSKKDFRVPLFFPGYPCQMLNSKISRNSLPHLPLSPSREGGRGLAGVCLGARGGGSKLLGPPAAAAGSQHGVPGAQPPRSVQQHPARLSLLLGAYFETTIAQATCTRVRLI